MMEFHSESLRSIFINDIIIKGNVVDSNDVSKPVTITLDLGNAGAFTSYTNHYATVTKDNKNVTVNILNDITVGDINDYLNQNLLIQSLE